MRLAGRSTTRWWLIGIALVCGLALLAPGLVKPRGVSAATVVVDQFSTDQASLWAYPDPSVGLVRDSSSSVSGPGILGGERDMRVRANIADISNETNGMWAFVNNGIFESHRQIDVTGTNEIQWDGPDGDGETLDPTGLGGVDLTGGGTDEAFLLGVAYYNLGAPNATITVYTDAANASSYTVNFTFSNSHIDYLIKFSDFTPTLGAGADFTNVGAITIFMNVTSGGGPYFDFLQTAAIDDEPPVTTPTLDGTVGDAGWYTSQVQVTLSATDNHSGVDDTSYRVNGGPWTTYSSPFTVSDQGNTTVEFYSTDNEGNIEATKSTSFKIDTVTPTTTASLSGTLGDNGWYTGPVQVTLNPSDATSGISYTNYNAIGGGGVPYSGPFTLNDDGEYNVIFFSVDQAGNSESFKSVTVKIDQTAPTISGSADPPANANGWNNTNVTVSFTCSDGTDGSGVDSVTPDTTLTDEGTNQSVDGSCTDLAGNSATPASVSGINIDQTVPVISASSIETADGQPFTPGAGIWTNQDVAVTFICVETGAVQSGLDQNTVGSVMLTTEGAGQTATNAGVCTDLAGNRASDASVSGINIDKTAPTAVSGGPYTVNEGSTVLLDGSRSTDGLSGVASIAWALDSDDQFAEDDPFTFGSGSGNDIIAAAVQVIDYAGNVTVVSTTITVNNLPPEIHAVTNDGPPSSGSTVNITVDATDPAGALDPLSYEFDCDNDLDYEIGPQPENSAACDIGLHEGDIIVNVRVTDGDGGEALSSTVISVPTEMCASKYTGLLRYDDGCRDYELSVVLASDPVSICVSNYTGVLRYLQHGLCSWSETWLSLPDDGPLAVCISGYTQVMRAVDDIATCQPFETGRIIGNGTNSSPTGAGNDRTR